MPSVTSGRPGTHMPLGQLTCLTSPLVGAASLCTDTALTTYAGLKSVTLNVPLLPYAVAPRLFYPSRL